MLYGRDAERAQLEALLHGTQASRSGVLVLRGEAGIGKSALLEHAVAGRGDLPVLRAAGVEAESELAFAGLHQLLRPALALLDRLPHIQAAALASAFGLGDSEVGNRFLVSLGALGLLSDFAEACGALCVVDDAQWLDEPSAGALLFVARRLEAEGVALLIGARDGDVRAFAADGLPELRLRGLGDDDAGALLGARAGPGLATAVRDRLLGFARGNPLVLIELARSLSADQLSGREPLAEPLPVGENVERAFLRRIGRLDRDARRLLLLVAADDSGDLAAVLRAAEVLGTNPDALDELEAAELLRVDGQGITFRQPLVRSAVYGSASFSQREAAHLALAAAMPDEADADRRAWHFAAASPGPDPAAAEELERSAVRARLRGGHTAAATALERAARLSEDDASRARRLLAAAEANWLGGRADRAGPLVREAAPLLSDPEQRARAALLQGSYEFERGRPSDGYAVLVAGAQEISTRDPRLALELLVRALEAAVFSGRIEWLAELAELSSAIVTGSHRERRFMVALIEGTARHLGGDQAAAVVALERARELAEGFEHPRYLLSAATADHLLGDLASAHARRLRAVAQLRVAGALGELAMALELLAATEIWLGQYGSAAANAAEGLRLASATGQDTNASFQLAALARTEALLGRETECRAHAADAIRVAAVRGLALPAAGALVALGQLELALGRPQEALAHLAAITDPDSELAHPLAALHFAPDLLEAAVRSERADLGPAIVERFAAWAERTPTRWPRAALARMRALLAEPAVAGEHFEEALRRFADAELPLEHARTRLLYGEHLRRSRRRADARPHLRAAIGTFERLGAQPWAERARVELRATGETARRREPSTLDQLTPQELQIARFVSDGASNREVAAKLFISPRTVEYHLRKVFTKLGITSRGELARMLPQQPVV